VSNIDLLVNDSAEVARLVAGEINALARGVLSDELVYTPSSSHSYYRDLLASQTRRVQSPGHQDRLQRHAEQMEAIDREHRARDMRRLSGVGIEYRVTPDRTDGYGGYFSPPAWLNQLFATANRPGRVLAGLMPRFPLPAGVSTVNVPVINAGTVVDPSEDDSAVPAQDLTDQAATSNVVPFAGQADVALQLLEQSPAGGHLDWAIFQDLSEAYDDDLEVQLLAGADGTSQQLLGVTQVSAIVTVNYTGTSGSNLWVALSKVAAQVADGRSRPPECWLMRSARWFYLQGSEDTATRPFGLGTQFFLGNDDQTPDPISGLMGLPVFLDDAITATNGTAGNQDLILCLRPRDLILMEGDPRTVVAREPLSAALGVRLQMHCNAAAITGRRPAGIGQVTGTGLAVASGY